jgi:hypothetical protein
MKDGVLHGSKMIKYVPATSVVKLEVGYPIALGAEDFERLAKAFFADLESKFL